MTTITHEQALKLILQAKENRQFYSVDYIKKNGEFRVASAHPSVKKYLKGGVATYNKNNPDNIGYYDLEKKGYRSFNINQVVSLRTGGKQYTVA